jgi:hypothetical protein
MRRDDLSRVLWPRLSRAKAVMARLIPEPSRDGGATLPLTGFEEHRTRAPSAELLADDDLAELNRLLPWGCFTVDSRGRRIGNWTRPGRRDTPQPIPDPRIELMDSRFGLAGKHVLELGCFEGVHTIGLAQRAGRVTAVDSNVANVVKTIVRCSLYGCHPDVFVCNVETWTDEGALEADLLHHVGVLYHLRDPVPHLLGLGRYIKTGVLLDTHVATGEDATESMVVGGTTYRFKRWRESPGRRQMLAGMYDHSKWLLLDDVVSLLRAAGFGSVEVADQRLERNGLRVTILAGRAPGE